MSIDPRSRARSALPASCSLVADAARARSRTPTSSRRRRRSSAATGAGSTRSRPALAGHCSSATSRTGSSSRGSTTRRPDDVAGVSSRAIPDGPLAERLRIEWLKIARQARRLEPASRSTIAPQPARTSSSRATRSSTATSATARARSPLPGRCGSPAQSTPDACEPLFAALIARGDYPLADRRARFRLAAEAGNARLAQAIADDLPGQGAHHRARIRARSIAIRCARWRRASSRGRRRRAATSRSTRSSARRARTRRDARDAWVKWRERLPERGPQLRQPAHRLPRGAPARSVRATNGSAKSQASRSTPEAAGVARARGAARRRVARRASPRSTRCRRPSSRSPPGATGGARAGRAGRRDEARAHLRGARRASSSYYGLLAAEALGQGAAR